MQIGARDSSEDSMQGQLKRKCYCFICGSQNTSIVLHEIDYQSLPIISNQTYQMEPSLTALQHAPEIQSMINGSKMKTQLCRHFEKIKQMFARERLFNSRTEQKDRNKIPKTADAHDFSFRRYAEISSHEIRQKTMEASSAQLDALLLKSKSLNVKKLNVIFQFSSLAKLSNKRQITSQKNKKSKLFLKPDPAIKVKDGTKSQFFKKLKKQYSPEPTMQKFNKRKDEQREGQNIRFSKSVVLDENILKNKIKPNILRRQYFRHNIKQLKRDQSLLQNFHKILQQKSMEVRTPSTLGPWKDTPKENPEF